MLLYWLVVLFVLGACVGSFLNVCIYRMPLEKSILWPASRCGHCYQAIEWYDNIPLLSYLLLRGRCRSCGQRFSFRYFAIELGTGLAFAGLFQVTVLDNIHQFPALAGEAERIQETGWPSPLALVVFAHHAVLVSLLIVASICDLDHREIPLAVTLPGSLLGLVLALLLPWPWPYTPAEAPLPPPPSGWLLGPLPNLKVGLYPWPVWPWPPAWLPPGDWRLGLATGLAGLLVGTILLRVIRFVFSLGLGMEALGLGDADLMMMAGAFLGWQPIVVAFFLGVFAGLFFGVGQMLLTGDNALPFGPGLSVGILAALFGWPWIGPHVEMLFSNSTLLLFILGVGSVLMLVASYLLRLLRLMRGD